MHEFVYSLQARIVLYGQVKDSSILNIKLVIKKIEEKETIFVLLLSDLFTGLKTLTNLYCIMRMVLEALRPTHLITAAAARVFVASMG